MTSSNLNNKILLIQNKADLRHMVRLSLESDGFHVYEAYAPEETMALAQQEKPNLIVLDLMAPDIDGFELARALKENAATADIPILILSLVNQDKEQLVAGIADYISKPLKSHELSQKIKTILKTMQPSKKTRHALVVDDEPDIVEVISLILQDAGFTITQARNGAEAIEKLESCAPDIIITDITMPKMNGFELIEHIRTIPRLTAVPIIVLTGTHIAAEHRQRGLKLGATKYLTKPFSINNLVMEIEETLCKAQKS